MASINELKPVRSSIKLRFKRIQDYVQRIKHKQVEYSNDDIHTRLKFVDSAYSDFNDVQFKIYALCKEDEEMKEATAYEADIEDRYLELEGFLNSLIVPIPKKEPSVDSFQKLAEQQAEFLRRMGEVTHDTSSSSLPISSPYSDIKLARLTLPEFHGEYHEFQSWYDIFKTQVHENAKYKIVDKFGYLKMSCKGKAAKLISSIPVTDANYTEALKKITDRYDKNRVLINAHINKFLDQPNITKTTSSTLRDLADTSDQIIRSIKSLPEEFQTREPWLVCIMTMKLDDIT